MIWLVFSLIVLFLVTLAVAYKQIPQFYAYYELCYEYDEYSKFIKDQQTAVKKRKSLLNKCNFLEQKIEESNKKSYSLKSLITYIALIMPEDVKLTRMHFNSSDQNIILHGESKTYYTLIDFMTNLSHNLNFYNVKLINLTKIDSSSSKLMYEISIHYFKKHNNSIK